MLAISATKKRGPTMMHNIHTRNLREVIICNEFGQPIGPVTEENDVVGKFSRFLGTISRTYSYAPLIYNSWHKVPDKDRMWEYVLVCSYASSLYVWIFLLLLIRYYSSL